MAEVPEIRDLESMLRKYFKKNIKIISQKSKLLTAPGENYGSVMAALTVTIEDGENKQNLNLVAKLIPRNEMLKEMFQVQVTFIKELSIYTKVVPILAEIEDEHGITKDRSSDLFAKCYGGRSNLKETEGYVDDDSVLLLENLKPLGFETGDRLVGFDYDTAVFILKLLAKFHASPIAVKHLKPELFERVFLDALRAPENKNKMEKEKCMKFNEGIKNIVYEEKYKVQAEELMKHLEEKMECFWIASDPQETFATFCHADFWVNNMMLKKDSNGKPSKLIVVDFQTPLCKSSVVDLLFFLYSSVSPSILYEKVDELIKIYYESFIKRLEEFHLDLDKFCWEAFTAEIKKKAPNVLSQVLIMYQPILLERGKIENMNTFEEHDMLNIDHVSEHCKKCMKKAFRQFAEKGWI